MRLVRAVPALVLTVGMLAGCGSRDTVGSTPETSTSQSAHTATPSAEAPASDLVGRWEREVTCHELVQDLGAAGLGRLAPYAWLGQTSSDGQNSFSAGSPPPTRTHPCTGALPRKHSHFFTSSVQFGSLDWLGGQVDDGQYVVTGHSTVKVGTVTFHYRVVNNTLRLQPVLTKAMVRHALSRPEEFSDAGWAVSVGYPGQTWERVPCGQWC